jgi:hypothetical protein
MRASEMKDRDARLMQFGHVDQPGVGSRLKRCTPARNMAVDCYILSDVRPLTGLENRILTEAEMAPSLSAKCMMRSVV